MKRGKNGKKASPKSKRAVEQRPEEKVTLHVVTKNASSAAADPNVPLEPVDLVALRKFLTNLVGNEAVAMVESTVTAVKAGHYAALKYLFEMIGLFPANPAQEAAEEEESLMRVLLRRLELPEEPILSVEAQANKAATGGDQGSVTIR